MFRSTTPLLLLLLLPWNPVVVFGFSMIQKQSVIRTSYTPLQAAPEEAEADTTTASRREILSLGGGAIMITAAAFAVSPILPAFADVSDGNTLPQGAQQFSRMIRVKNDLKNVEKRVKDAGANSEIDKKEWDNIGQFLRQVYNVGDDMKAMSKGIYDPTKQKQALEDAEGIKKYAKAADVPASKQDGNGFLSYAAKLDSFFDDYMVQLSDVPDEL